MTKQTWEQFQRILAELGVKPEVNVIHAGDASRPTGLMVRVRMEKKFNVAFEPEAEPEPPKRGRPRKSE